MLVKLSTLPRQSATASASSQAPLLRSDGRVSITRKTAKNATTVIRANASSQASRTVAILASCR